MLHGSRISAMADLCCMAAAIPPWQIYVAWQRHLRYCRSMLHDSGLSAIASKLFMAIVGVLLGSASELNLAHAPVYRAMAASDANLLCLCCQQPLVDAAIPDDPVSSLTCGHTFHQEWSRLMQSLWFGGCFGEVVLRWLEGGKSA